MKGGGGGREETQPVISLLKVNLINAVRLLVNFDKRVDETHVHISLRAHAVV